MTTNTHSRTYQAGYDTACRLSTRGHTTDLETLAEIRTAFPNHEAADAIPRSTDSVLDLFQATFPETSPEEMCDHFQCDQSVIEADDKDWLFGLVHGALESSPPKHSDPED